MSALRWLERHVEEAICCTCLVVISVAVISQVAARYIFEIALHWTEETAAIAMVWAFYSGASLCVRERFHIRIMVAVQSLPPRYGKYVIFLADICWAAFCIFMIRVSWDYLYIFWRFTETSPSLGINQFYPQTILLFGYVGMLLRLLQTYVNWFRDGQIGLPGELDESGDLDELDEAHL